ncbi:hypothetical protein GGX14DRAFT_696086 [Mycena pura]|uniref:NAD(P)-binding protein n=1 Tax=Mycena pura TaxID=153505 RepID=A0AAD6VQ55_9AGAR|nr:hypothetical protein GGX14DRAFT_696086 [Mycena pura]
MSTAHQHNPTRVALVTGAAQGIGRAIALRLAADGLDVGVAGRPAKLAALNGLVEEIEALGRKALAVAADVSNEGEVQAMVDATVSALGRLDVMVANAGVSSRASAVSVMDADIADWERDWDANIRGTIFCYKHAARQMVKQGDGGRIIGASSICGLRGFARAGGYCISKAAVCSLTQTTALELREHRITVNAYAPGVIETPMIVSKENDGHDPASAGKKFLNVAEFRTGQPADVAAVVSFLAAEDAHFVTADGLDVGVADLPAKLAALNGLVEEIEALGRKAHPIAADVSKEAEVQAMVDATVSAFGRLDVMVVNAGVSSRAKAVTIIDGASAKQATRQKESEDVEGI